MLAVSPLRSTSTREDERQEQIMESTFSNGGNEEFPDLLESIDFDDLFVGINDGDVLPDLEMDPEILAEFSVSTGSREDSEMNTSSVVSQEKVVEDKNESNSDCNNNNNLRSKGDDDKVSNSNFGLGLDSSLSTKGEEIVSKRDEKSDKGRKSVSSTTAQSKNSNNNNNQGKRKVKVDWTPELHRRFVQAVEQLGVDKAVPSRILEIMGIDCLTRHNIASHLQKYRSHRKHLLAREAEAATWSRRRQMYGAAGGGGGVGKRDHMTPWNAPTIGFPPITPMQHPHHHHHYRPLHVWGHPPIDQPLMYMWPKHLAAAAHSPSPPPPLTWPPPPPDPSFWHQHHLLHQQVPNGLIPAPPGPPWFPQPLTPPRYGTGTVPGIPPHAMYKVEAAAGIGVPTRQSPPAASHPLLTDFYPSKESVDAVIGDVLSKPWLPLPLGLKPPSLDGVFAELQKQGVPKIPPTCA